MVVLALWPGDHWTHFPFDAVVAWSLDVIEGLRQKVPLMSDYVVVSLDIFYRLVILFLLVLLFVM